MARLRGRNEETIIEHLKELKKIGKLSADVKNILKQKISKDQTEEIEKVHKAVSALGKEKLKPIYDHFDGKISYTTIHLASLFLD